MTETQPSRTETSTMPAGLSRASVPEPRLSTENARREAEKAAKSSARKPGAGRWVGAGLAVLLVFGAGVGATLWATGDSGRPLPESTVAAANAPAARPTSSGTPTYASTVMPDYRGSMIMAGAYGLRSVLGQELVVQSPGGAAVQYELIAQQDPAPGTTITAASVITFWPASSVGGSSSSTGYSAPAPGQFTSGTYEVGGGPGEIAPGKYVAAAGSSSCYYARLRNMDGGVGSIIDNHGEYRGGQVILNVKDSDQAVELSGDCTFTRR